MDMHTQFVKEKQVERTITHLKKNNMEGHFVKSTEELHKILLSLIPNEQTVGFGGTMTLFETGTLDWLRKRPLKLLDRYQEGLTQEDIQSLYRACFSADTYIMSANAITEDGTLYNVDGLGNRVAALIYGPKQVVVIAGTNKIVKDYDQAVERNQRTAAPANAKRLNRNTPCAKLGYCTVCSSPERICSAFVTVKKQMDPHRIKVIIIDGDYGY